MSGHSKWATTHRQKEINDAKKGKIFTKIANVISIAAREKGGNPDTNFGLRLAIDRGKAVNMPKDNIERAIKRGTGELAGNQIEELYYEAIGPGNSQFIIKCLTDNKNRSASEMRHIVGENNGSIGSVMWNFSKKGVIKIGKEEVDKNKLESEDVQLELIDKGVEDIKKEEEGIIIYSTIENLTVLKNYFDEKGVKIESADIEYIAKSKIELSGEDREKLEKFIEDLDDSEDVSDYYTNVNL